MHMHDNANVPELQSSVGGIEAVSTVVSVIVVPTVAMVVSTIAIVVAKVVPSVVVAVVGTIIMYMHDSFCIRSIDHASYI